jgi:Ribbon-helix-helix protein, copG family
MHMLDRRFQILLDPERFERLSHEARARGISVAALIREAIDRAYPRTSTAKARAAGRILSAPDMPVPDPAGLRSELEALRGRRG